MTLSVIIVNYNVKYFLEQCLHSVIKASQNITTEIFVVDNNSVDGSNQLIKEKFPEVHLIENSENVGFSKANNQAIRLAKGRYILLLNPDTVVEEDTFSKTIAFMEQHPDAGGLGVKMIDGKGNFLPESKRGLPTPFVAFCKMTGLSKLFPNSKKCGAYHLTYLDKEKIHSIDVLAGAFMLLRHETLKKVGLLDEEFFMYGEDIDLSYRITLGGYKNYYFPETTIIHYKGESTKKGSLNYVKVFYKAMIIFAEKHFSGEGARLFSMLLNIAIWLRALLSIINKVVIRFFTAFIDIVLIFTGFSLLTPVWESLRYEPGYYPPEFMKFVVPIYILIWITAILFSGGYKKPVNLLYVARGILWGAVSILLIYSLVDEEYRFSRALIIFGSIWATTTLILYRVLLNRIRRSTFGIDILRTKKIAIIGHLNEAVRVQDLLRQTDIKSEIAGFISMDDNDRDHRYIGSISQLNEVVIINRIDEVIFCAENISSTEIIQAMMKLTHLDIDFKIAPPESISIIGSNSIHTAGDLYIVHLNAISRSSNRRKKRWFDIISSFVILLLSPILIWFFKRKGQYFKNVFSVILGRKSLVGYIPTHTETSELPIIKEGVLTPATLVESLPDSDSYKNRLNFLYARDYNLKTDIEIVFNGWKNLDQKYSKVD